MRLQRQEQEVPGRSKGEGCCRGETNAELQLAVPRALGALCQRPRSSSTNRSRCSVQLRRRPSRVVRSVSSSIWIRGCVATRGVRATEAGHRRAAGCSRRGRRLTYKSRFGRPPVIVRRSRTRCRQRRCMVRSTATGTTRRGGSVQIRSNGAVSSSRPVAAQWRPTSWRMGGARQKFPRVIFGV